MILLRWVNLTKNKQVNNYWHIDKSHLRFETSSTTPLIMKNWSLDLVVKRSTINWSKELRALLGSQFIILFEEEFFSLIVISINCSIYMKKVRNFISTLVSDHQSILCILDTLFLLSWLSKKKYLGSSRINVEIRTKIQICSNLIFSKSGGCKKHLMFL